MFNEDKKYVMRNFSSLRKEYRSYESDILKYFEDKNLRNYKEPLRLLFSLIADNTLVSIYKKINKNKNKPDWVENMILDYFRKYDIDLVKTRSEKRKKEDKKSVAARVRKHREKLKKLKKVSFQCSISPQIKTKINKLKLKHSLKTNEQLLEYLINQNHF